MIDAERMLGSLVRSALNEGTGLGRHGRKGRRRRRRRGSSLLGGSAKGALGMGALAVAFGAWEHFSQKQAASSPSATGTPPPPPPSPASPASPAAADLPPLPPLPTAAAPPAPETGSSAGEALLLVRAMIAAANADHELDDDERGRILEALDEADADPEDKAFLLAELEEPADPATLAAAATTPELAQQIYLASLLAIDVDTRAERNYLDRLARRLGLDEARAADLERQLAEAASADEAEER